MTTITLCPTKAGHGYKCVVDGTWFYTSAQEVEKMLRGEAHACKLRTIDEWRNNGRFRRRNTGELSGG